MEIEQARKARENLEADISQLLAAFMSETGLSIRSVHVSMIDNTPSTRRTFGALVGSVDIAVRI